MAKKWAIVVGIDQYKRLQPLRFAERDAKAIRAFLLNDAGFDQVYYFSDHAPEIVLEGVSISTQPTVANLRRFLELRFAAPFLKQGDTLWFFFSGYGLQYANADYLLPSDVEPEAAETTAITMDALADCLSRSGTEQIVLFLDACRTEDQKFGQGFGTDPNGVITLFSTAFGETAQELEAVQLGAFAHVLLEGLQVKGRKPDATVAELFQYLYNRLPQVNLSHSQPSQSPRLSVNAPIRPEAMLLPQTIDPVTVRAGKQKPAMAKAEPNHLESNIAPAIDLAAQQSNKVLPSKVLQAVAASLVTLAIGLAGITLYQVVSPYLTTPQRWDELWAGTWSKTTPSPSLPPVPSPNTFSIKNNFYQRLPRIGRYAAIVSLFNQSYREISSMNGRFCIKLVNAPTKPSGYQQITVSTLSFRDNGVYIDATQEQLKIDGTFTEVTDRKSTWQWAKNDVDRSGLVAECLVSTTPYVREVKGLTKK
ncbi:caspase family protein [Stenomitos frigidus]|uniref:Peptidase C14 caspase domain-containing protein n=1 Tax=Stenomitos frigidus ULC18 TaxID=2107698 RepID=A0A2T1DZI9_9CYAN|nr:caspase family protein [Stenomitos frigidus]PSB25913.1 hypothetical protein C7B82_21485 [Stenomitos frigidus ULC18]